MHTTDSKNHRPIHSKPNPIRENEEGEEEELEGRRSLLDDSTKWSMDQY